MKIIIIFVSVCLPAFAGGNHELKHQTTQAHTHSEQSKSTVGQPVESDKATKIINVKLLDAMKFKFSPVLDVDVGDIVQFVVVNTGQVRHEFSIGDVAEQKAHVEMMKKMPDMVHEDGNTITVDPGETKEITWHFLGSGRVVFACNIPGHFEAGMHESVVL